jgi:hypothetical protein
MTQSPETTRTASAPLLFGLMVLLITVGCGSGSGQGLDLDGDLPSLSVGGGTSGGETPGGGAGASGNPNATLAWVQTNVFGGVCSQCHIGAGAPFGVDWSSQAKTCTNVGRRSAELAQLMEIDSGNPATSYVIWKVEGAGPNGESIVQARMPLSNPPLTADTIQNMRDWIADGVPGC